MPEFLFRMIFNILTGYVRIIKAFIIFLLQIILLCFFSFIIVFPLWYFAIYYKTGYNIFIFIFFLAIIGFTAGIKIINFIHMESRKKLKTGFGLPVFLRFFILIAELYLIRYLLLSGQLLFSIPGMVLLFEFLFFLCLIKGNKKVLISWMKTVLIILTSFDLIYNASVLFSRGNHLYALSIGTMYILAIGYLLHPGKSKKIKTGKKI